MNKLTDQEIGWVVGIVEADGCLGSYLDGRGYPNFSIRVCMTDEDVVKRLQTVVGAGSFSGPIPRGMKDSPTWTWALCKRDDVLKLLCTLLPLFGNRRTAKADKIIGHIELLKDLARIKTENAKNQPCSVDGCEERNYYAKGYCSNHYQSLVKYPAMKSKEK